MRMKMTVLTTYLSKIMTINFRFPAYVFLVWHSSLAVFSAVWSCSHHQCVSISAMDSDGQPLQWNCLWSSYWLWMTLFDMCTIMSLFYPCTFLLCLTHFFMCSFVIYVWHVHIMDSIVTESPFAWLLASKQESYWQMMYHVHVHAHTIYSG